VKLIEITLSDKSAYRLAYSRDLLSDVSWITTKYPDVKNDYERFKNSTSNRIRTFVKSQISDIYNRCVDIEDLCNKVLNNNPRDREAKSIKRRIIPIIDNLEEMYNSI
jgi:molecular chaperone GrpE (heat shock protein)